MMNYRQWKKNYKKLHGYNPLVKDDRRKRAKVETILRNMKYEFLSSISAQMPYGQRYLFQKIFFNEVIAYDIYTYKTPN